MNKSDQINELASALAKAQGAYKPAIKDAANPFFKSKYADLAGCIDAIRAALSANGLAVVQITHHEPMHLETSLIHSSGQWISSTYPVNPVKNDPQGIGSAITYARRYSLMALVGLAAEDDDGEAASGRSAKTESVTGQPAKKIPSWTKEQLDEIGSINSEILRVAGDKLGNEDITKRRSRMKYDAPTDVIDDASRALAQFRDIAADTKE